MMLYLLPLLLVFSIARAEQKPYLISGFDDVLRQAENTGLIKAAIKILEDDKGFSGMPELYQVISGKEASPQFGLVSAISNWFDKRIDNFLLKFHFPSNRRYLRNWLTEWSIESFKIEKIKEILKQKSDRKFIVIFDNSEASITLAEEIKRQFSENVVAIYLRQVQDKKIPAGATGFYTAFDIAVNEYEAGRLSSEEVSKIGQVILNEKDINSLIPAYAKCPSKNASGEIHSLEIKDICINVSQHIQTLCRH